MYRAEMKEASSYDPPPFMVDPDKIRVHRAVLRHKESVRRISEPFKHKICYNIDNNESDGHIFRPDVLPQNAQPVLCRILCRRICGTCALPRRLCPTTGSGTLPRRLCPATGSGTLPRHLSRAACSGTLL